MHRLLKKPIAFLFIGSLIFGCLHVLACECRDDFPKVDRDLATYTTAVQQMKYDFSKVPANPKDKVWVKAKLQHMCDVDQYMRHFTETPVRHNYSDAETKCFQSIFGDIFKTVDEANTADLKALLKLFPWFKISEFGKDADQQAWILVQHADRDPDFQAKILKTLEPLAKQGETRPANYAYLYDRVAASFSSPEKRRAQRYGTQGICKAPNDWQPLEIEDPANLDKRRAEMGLPPFSEYKKLVNQMCH